MSYSFPKTSLLKDYRKSNKFTEQGYAEALGQELMSVLESYKIEAKIMDARASSFAIMYDIRPIKSVSIKTLQSLRADLELWMTAPVEVINSGVHDFTIGLAIKSINRSIVGLREIMESEEFRNNDYKLPIAAGMDILGSPFVFDLAATPHLLVAGTTGSGKSTFLNDLIMSMVYTKTPEEVQMVMIDPKMVELSCYKNLPHLMQPVIYRTDRAMECIAKINKEMDDRFSAFLPLAARSIEGYNAKVTKTKQFPRIIVIVDEYMEMMMQPNKQIEPLLTRIARMGRAAGIHMVLATQRPSADVITPEIKANIPCRASFTVVDWRESKTIIDRTGAERLLGSGDMLYSIAESAVPVHAQAAYVSDDEIDKVIAAISKNA